MGKFLYLQNEKVVRCYLDVNTGVDDKGRPRNGLKT